MSKYYLNTVGLCCAAGSSRLEVADNVFSISTQNENFLTQHDAYLHEDNGYYIGRVDSDLPVIPKGLEKYNSRNNRMLMLCFMQIEAAVRAAIKKHGTDRVSVILGTSTSGIAEGEDALFECKINGAFPSNYCLGLQEIADGSEFLAQWLGLENIAVTISTACSSSAKTFAHAREMLAVGICDVAIVGGVDSLCHLTINGFHSLGALSDQPCNPFSQNRSGISIGEGGALFLMSREPSGIEILAIGESSDAYSMTAPHPEGKGTEQAMRSALDYAKLDAKEIAYVNLHGTATNHNDAMENIAVESVFGKDVLCSSSKSLVGHTLGGAGALETALCWLMLDSEVNPERKALPHVWDGVCAEDITLNNFAKIGQKLPQDKRLLALSNFCAFGGSNASVILGEIE